MCASFSVKNSAHAFFCMLTAAGVSMQENARYLAALRKLLDRPDNRACADCKEGGAGSRPSWASINTGVFICMRCAGIHRGLGVHVSKVGPMSCLECAILWSIQCGCSYPCT